MNTPEQSLSEIAGRWRSSVVLKRDVFSVIERGRFVTPEGEVETVLRRIDEVPWWAWPLARHLFARERNPAGAVRTAILQLVAMNQDRSDRSADRERRRAGERRAYRR